jgi:hypothetical protein
MTGKRDSNQSKRLKILIRGTKNNKKSKTSKKARFVSDLPRPAVSQNREVAVSFIASTFQ